jgi:membrane protease YdiL (CAAX protease family)
LALVTLQECFLFAGGHVRWTYMSPALPMGWLSLGLISYFLLALREEIAFRAYPLRRLEHDLGL